MLIFRIIVDVVRRIFVIFEGDVRLVRIFRVSENLHAWGNGTI